MKTKKNCQSVAYLALTRHQGHPDCCSYDLFKKKKKENTKKEINVYSMNP